MSRWWATHPLLNGGNSHCQHVSHEWTETLSLGESLMSHQWATPEQQKQLLHPLGKERNKTNHSIQWVIMSRWWATHPLLSSRNNLYEPWVCVISSSLTSTADFEELGHWASYGSYVERKYPSPPPPPKSCILIILDRNTPRPLHPRNSAY